MTVLASTNWFCFSGIKTTFYLVREQANIAKRVNGKETIENFVRIMTGEEYKNTCLIISDIEAHSPDAFNYSLKRNRKKFSNPYVIVKDIKLYLNRSGCEKFKDIGIFKKGVIHGRSTMNNVLHICVFLGYKRIIFVGVDLYNSRYFWLKKNETRYSVSYKKRNYKNKHAISKPTIDLLEEFKRTNEIKIFSYNPKSTLTKVMPVWKRE